MADVFKALADPTRRELLLRVTEEPQPINALAEQFSMSRPAVSKHLRILESAKLLRFEAGGDGRQRIAYAQLEATEELRTYLGQLAEFWQQKLDGLDAYLTDSDADKPSI